MKPSSIALLVLLAVGIAAIVGMYSDSSTSATFAEAGASPDKEFYITGQLVKDSAVMYNPEIDPNYFTFFLEDKEGVIRKVATNEPKVQDFERAESVTMIGSLRGDVFEASKVLPKCPSKYKDEQNAKEANQMAEAAKS